VRLKPEVGVAVGVGGVGVGVLLTPTKFIVNLVPYIRVEPGFMTGCTRNDSAVESTAKKVLEVVPALIMPALIINPFCGLVQEELAENDTEAALNNFKATGSFCATVNGDPFWSIAVSVKRVHWPVEMLAGPEITTPDSTGVVAASATASLAPLSLDAIEVPAFA